MTHTCLHPISVTRGSGIMETLFLVNSFFTISFLQHSFIPSFMPSARACLWLQAALCTYLALIPVEEPCWVLCGQISPRLCKHLCIVAGRNILNLLKLLDNVAFILTFEQSDCRHEILRKSWEEFSSVLVFWHLKCQNIMANKIFYSTLIKAFLPH